MYKSKILPWLFLVPILLFIVIFLFYPFGINIYHSFFSFTSILDQNPTFIGFNNYTSLILDQTFITSFFNTVILVGLVLVFQVGIALLLALLVSSIDKLASLFKVTFFMPIVISATALGLMFNLFYDYDFGMFNQLLVQLGFEKVFWMDPLNLTRRFLLTMGPVLWQYIGFYFVIFLTALAGVSDEIIEASEIDGCTGIQKALKIKIPMIQNVTRTVFVLAITGTLKVFDLPHVISPGGYPNGKLHLLGTYMYEKAFNSNQLGIAAAFAVIIAISGVIFSGISNKLLKQNKDL